MHIKNTGTSWYEKNLTDLVGMLKIVVCRFFSTNIQLSGHSLAAKCLENEAFVRILIKLTKSMTK